MSTRAIPAALCILIGWSVAMVLADEKPPVVATTAVSGSFEVVRSITYATRDENQLLADVYTPQAKDGPYPVILMVHGGAWFSGNKVHVTMHARHAAERGYAVVAINYRLAPTHRFPAQLEDCRMALDWIGRNAEKYDFDRDRVAAYGYSAGAHLVCLLGTTMNASEQFDANELPKLQAIVAGGTPCEFSWIPANSNALGYWLGGPRTKHPDVYQAASPIEHVDVHDPPIFFFHGSKDRVVPMSSPRLMLEKLRALGVRSDLLVAQGGSHITTFLRPEMRQRAIDFLDQELK